MNIAVCYLLPLDNFAERFKTHANEWASTYKLFLPTIKHDVVIVFSNGVINEEHKTIFNGIEFRSIEFNGGGWDIGAFQASTKVLDYDFVVFMNARTYFWKEGWLERLVDARQSRGEGLYGASASYEFCSLWCRIGSGRNSHIRTSCFGCNPKILAEYPYLIDSREKSFEFESGMWNFAQWFEDIGMNVMMVTWDGEYLKADWRKPPNIFRRGDQSNCLVRDRHTRMYETACATDKKVFEKCADIGSA